MSRLQGIADSDYDVALSRGIRGEEIVGGELERRLAGTGVVVDHSIRFLGWGDIDHLTVGPGGVTVVDAKNWSDHVTVRDGAPCAGGRRRPRELEKLKRQLAGVHLALLHANPNLRGVAVRGVMCMASEPELGLRAMTDTVFLCGSSHAADFAARSGSLSPEDIAHLRAVLLRQLPTVHRREVDAFLTPPPVTPQAHKVGGTRNRGIRRRRFRSRGRRAMLALAAVAAIVVGLGVIGALMESLRHDRVSNLAIARSHGRVVVRFSARRGDTVAILVIAGRHRKRVEVVANGSPQEWRGQRVGDGDRLVADACVLGLLTHRCEARAVQARGPSRRGRWAARPSRHRSAQPTPSHVGRTAVASRGASRRA